jgi:hypothetical protein
VFLKNSSLLVVFFGGWGGGEVEGVVNRYPDDSYVAGSNPAVGRVDKSFVSDRIN